MRHRWIEQEQREGHQISAIVIIFEQISISQPYCLQIGQSPRIYHQQRGRRRPENPASEWICKVE